MLIRVAVVAAVILSMAACGGDEPSPAVPGDAAVLAAGGDALAAACEPDARMAVEGRASPYDSASVAIGGAELKVCYGRPSVRDREIFGGLVPYDAVWRTGANEPTIIHMPVAGTIAGLAVDAGSYSLYTIPRAAGWTVIVNRSTAQWGIESQYTDAIQQQEVGRAEVPSESLASPVEMFTITAQSTGPNSANLVLEWENTRVSIPVTTTG